jgi:hypothetical protein
MKIALFQFGILVGIVCCLVYSRLEYSRPRPAAVKHVSAPDEQLADMVGADDDAESPESLTDRRVSALPNEYSPEAVERYRALSAKLYYEQIAPRRTAGSSSAAAAAPAYTELVEEPAVVNDPAPQTVAYVQPTQAVVYSPAQVVAFSRPRRFDNRCRPASHPNALAPNPHRRPDRSGITHLSAPPPFESPASPAGALRRPLGSSGILHRQKNGVDPCPSAQGFAPGGTH